LSVQPDIIFPLIHGINGEDGKMQWMLDFIGIPYIGTGVAGSAICMDKLFTKSLLPQYGIPLLPHFWFTDFEWSHNKDEVRRDVLSLGFPLFIKPANLWSSIGVARVTSEEELNTAIDNALRYDKRILAEKWLNRPREIELSVLGNHNYSVSWAGEIVIKDKYDFYTYEAKYIDWPAVYHEIPARIDTDILRKLQEITKKACSVLSVRWFSRIDFFVDSETWEFYLNELNTIPDMTLDGMLPGLWKHEGVEYSQLLDRLIEFALEK
jgi:D-alanine-D-alanine ligase